MSRNMTQTRRQIADRDISDITFDVAGIIDGRYIGPSEIRRHSDDGGTAGPNCVAVSGRLRPEQARRRLDALVEACGPSNAPSPFRKHKEQLITDLVAPYALFHFVHSEPDLVTMLREHYALKDRVRKIPKSKIALMCVYCKMRPASADERKSCSEWTIWLEQATYERIAPDDFVEWAMGVNFKDCRDEVRKRRQTEKTPRKCSQTGAGRARRLSVRETTEGADITLYGHVFSIPRAVLAEVIATIERAAPEGLIASSNDDNAGDTHE